MKKFASLLMVALLATATASAQKAQTPQTGDQFITRFQTFVINVEKAKDIPSAKWDSLNTTYKAFRMEFRNTYKRTLNNTQYKKYNELKVRYLKQCSLNRFGKSISKKAESVGGAIDGVFK
jgi:hypothetical protein